MTLQVWVLYETFFLLGDGEPGEDWDEAFEGQENGLCGAATGNYLCLRTENGLNEVSVAIHGAGDVPPTIDVQAFDVVEVSFPAQSEPLRVTTWDGQLVAQLADLEAVDLRVRYSIDPGDGDRPARCRLDMWPAAPAPNAMVRTGAFGRSHHRETADSQVTVAHVDDSDRPTPLDVADWSIPTTMPVSFGVTSDPPSTWSAIWRPDGEPERLEARWYFTDNESSDDWVSLTIHPHEATAEDDNDGLAPTMSTMRYERMRGVSTYSWVHERSLFEVDSPRKAFASR
ncbi:hypothetical protein ABIB25_005902 [Nakamurella sp. UYEF19]|uniref:hypothetical protein n=1 Tax=Nakamurella sp. UYEF19 TaxID=1756392 RepID=UPI0033967505